jgi:hypothetical protein
MELMIYSKRSRYEIKQEQMAVLIFLAGLGISSLPVACTMVVWGIIESAVNNPKYGNDYTGIIWDILHMFRNCPTKRWPTGCLFKVVIIGVGPKKIFTFKIECGPGDQREPVLTIMMPDED